MPFAAVGAALGISTGAAVLGAASIATSIYGASQAGNAADAQAEAAGNASAVQKGMYDQTRLDLAPYMTSGKDNLDSLNSMISSGQLGGKFTNADLNANMAPNYQFQLEQGQQALQNSQSARDGVLGGAALKDMQKFTQNTAAGAYQNAYSNWLSTQSHQYGLRANLASLGQNAAAQVGNQGVQTGQAIGQNMIGAGNAQAAGQIASANAMTSGVNSLGSYFNLNSLLPKTATKVE